MRTINPEEHAARRDEILDAAQQVLLARGYQRMTIQDVLDALGGSKGALYHYFETKQQLVEALIERMAVQAEARLSTALHARPQSALQAFRTYFAASNEWKVARKGLVLGLLRLWNDPENAFVRHKLAAESSVRTVRLLEPVIRQGVEEAVFTTRFPLEAARVVVALGLGLTDTLAGLVLDPAASETTLVQAHRALEAHVDHVERVLGAPPGALRVFDIARFEQWFVALRPPARAVPRRGRRAKP